MRKFNSNRAIRDRFVTFIEERFSECAQANILTNAKTFIATIKYEPWLILGRMPAVKTDVVAYLPAEGFGENSGGIVLCEQFPQELHFIKTLSF